MSQLNTALVGLKGVGRQHLKGLAESARAKLVAVADIDAEHAGRVADEHGARAYGDYRALLDGEKELDAVVFATPHHLHAPMSLDALRADCHVFVEKPIAIRVSEADAMVAEAAAQIGRAHV